MKALLPLAATLAALLAGCGSDDSGSSSSSSSSNSPGYGAPASTPATPSGGVTADAITVKDYAFDPADATVKVGQKVTWTNEDSAPHNVVADDGSIKSKTMQKGQSVSFTPKKAGTISYICTYHPQMKATLTVTG